MPEDGRQHRNDELQSEVNRIEEQVLEGYKNLVVLRNALEGTDKAVPAEGLANRIIEETEALKQQLAEAEKETLSKREAIERLKQDLKSLDEGKRQVVHILLTAQPEIVPCGCFPHRTIF